MPFGNRTHSSTRTGPFEDRDIGADGATGTARAGKAARPTAIPASRVVFAACRRALRPPRHPISLPRSHRDHSHTHRGASMSLRRTVAAAALAAVTLTLASRAGASPWVLKPGEFYSELTGFTELGWKKRASVWIQVPFVNRGFTRFSGGTSTSSGLGDIDLGVRFRLRGGSSPASLALGWTAPLGANRRLFPGTDGDGGTDPSHYPPASLSNVSDSSLYFNQGLQSLRVGLEFGGHAWKHAFWTLGGEYRYRFLEFASTGGDTRNARFFGGDASLGWWVHKNLLVSGLFQ